MNQSSSFNRVRRTALFLALMTLVATITWADAAYRVTRPIAIDSNYGYIKQDYLYGEDGGHKGVDFPSPLDRSVYAIADGVVQQIKENIDDDCHPPDSRCQYDLFGNFVLVRHTRQHYKRTPTPGQMAYVYSLYAHLSRDGALVNVGDSVVAGQLIGQVDNTGNSSGNHLHLQIMIDPNANRTVSYPLSWTESSSRNPELWLTPYNGNTGTVVGKVTDINGTAYPGVLVYGALSGYNPDGLRKNDAWNYGTSLTYRNGYNLNPDDILVENWATTDVTPGRYHILLSTGGDMGWYDVQAGRTTYVGLYSAWLPKVRGNYNGWNSTIVVRNNSPTYRAQVNTTFFNADGSVQSQRTDYINANAVANLPVPGGFAGSAVVVSSEDVAVVLEDQHTDGRTYAYNGLAAADPRNPDWGQVGTDIHLPLLMKDYYGWSTSVTILNTGSASAYYDFDCFGPTGATYHVAQTSLGVHASTTSEQVGSVCPSVGSGRITSDQPLAVIVTEKATGITSSHNGVSTGATTVSLPLIMANFYDYRTSIAVQNLGSAPANVTVTYYPAPGYANRTPDTVSNLPSRAATTLVQMGGQWGTERWIGAVRITANQPVAAVVNQASTGRQMSYNSFLTGSSVIVLPKVRNNYDGWTSSVQVQNLDNTSAYIIVRVNGIPYDAGWVGAYQSVTLVPLPGIGPGSEGPATVECTNGRRIVAIVDTTKSGAGDQAKDYSGLNR